MRNSSKGHGYSKKNKSRHTKSRHTKSRHTKSRHAKSRHTKMRLKGKPGKNLKIKTNISEIPMKTKIKIFKSFSIFLNNISNELKKIDNEELIRDLKQVCADYQKANPGALNNKNLNTLLEKALKTLKSKNMTVSKLFETLAKKLRKMGSNVKTSSIKSLKAKGGSNYNMSIVPRARSRSPIRPRRNYSPKENKDPVDKILDIFDNKKYRKLFLYIILMILILTITYATIKKILVTGDTPFDFESIVDSVTEIFITLIWVLGIIKGVTGSLEILNNTGHDEEIVHRISNRGLFPQGIAGSRSQLSLQNLQQQQLLRLGNDDYFSDDY